MGWLWGSSDSESTDPSSFSTDTSFSSTNYDSSSYGDSLSSASGVDTGTSGRGGDAELQQFIAKEQQKAQLQAMIHRMNEMCWDTCVGTPESKLNSRTETCIANCVERFIDSSLFITNRFAQLLSKSGGGL
ncbi:UNVERIFIED_CONTAM: hypothetical protein RMT77_003398 [Armadillidium vulgare]|nr:Mitochondrial import inner membrane translocase subunit Tim8 [Armadillidium vulgare]